MTVNQVGSTATNYNVGMGASSSTTASTTATSSASISSATSTSSTTAVSSTTATSNTASTTSNVGTVSSTTSYSSATAQTTCSTTIIYSGASSTAKVSSTTATTATTTTTSTSTTGASSSTTAVSNSSGTPTASVVATPTNTVGATMGQIENITISGYGTKDNVSVEELDVNSVESNTASTTPPIYAYLSHMGGEALQDIEKVLVELGYDDVQDGDFINSLERFKNDYGMSTYSTYSSEVIEKLARVYELHTAPLYTGLTGPGSFDDVEIKGDKYAGLKGSSLFCNISRDIFGFSFSESYAMYSLYEGLVKNYGDEKADYQFVRVIASCCEGYGDNYAFQQAAGLMASDNVQKFMESNGLSQESAGLLIRAIQNQNLVTSNSPNNFSNIIYKKGNIEECTQAEKDRISELYAQFDGKLDLGHMCATLASYLYEGSTFIADVGVYLLANDLTLEEAVGYGGDIFGISIIGDGTPSMNSSDYMADLDAKNIYELTSSVTSNIMDNLLQYYSELENGKINRAAEFVDNIGGDEGLKELENKIKEYESSEENDASVAWDFYYSLVSNSNVLLSD